MKQIFTIIYLCTWACIIPTANCLASSASPHALLNTQMNWQLIQPMLNPEQLPITVASTLVAMPPPSDQAREYLPNMRNADIEQGIVLRGGKLELEVMAQLYNVRIMLEEELCRNDLMDHSRISYGWININAAATGKTILLSHTNYHYKYYDDDENLADIPNDDNCLFVAFLQALELEASLAAVANLRNAVVNYLSQAPNIEQTILNRLAGDNLVNRLGSSNPRSMPTTDRPEQTKRKRYSAEDKARLLQKEQDRPHELTHAERCRLYNWRHAEELKQQHKQYCQTHAEDIKQYQKQYHQAYAEELKQQQKQYNQAHAEEIRQYQKQYQEQYYQAHAEELKQQQKQYNQAHAEEIKQYQKQYRQAHTEEMKQYHKQYNQAHAEELRQHRQNRNTVNKLFTILWSTSK